MMDKLLQIRCPLRFVKLIVISGLFLGGCGMKSQLSPKGYNLGGGEVRELGKSLNEISGISYNTDDGSLLAISDSKKKIFQIKLSNLKLKDYTQDIIGPDQDIEDVVKLDSSVYMLSSKGELYEAAFGQEDKPVINSYILDRGKGNDFETLYYDSAAGGLIMMCKSCVFDKGKHVRSAFRFDLATKTFDSTAFYTIDTDEVKSILKNSEAKFDPSAAAIHPISKQLFILSSAGNMIVVADLRGKILEVYNLNPDRFPQAEGIAFAPNGDMYISNEGKFGKASVRIFKFQSGTK